MVCKEEFVLWFKDLDSYQRIDVLCELLNMCVPFELRFVGSYLEEIGKLNYHELRQQTILANNVEKLEKDSVFKNQSSLTDEVLRHRLLINISLLKSRNYNAANWYNRKFLRTDYIEELVRKETDESVQNELLLLYMMVSRHPAFSFDQKQFFSRILVHLCDARESRYRACAYGYPPGFGYPNIQRKNMGPEAQVPMGFPMHPPGLPGMDFMQPFRGWPAVPCGAPEVLPFPQTLPPQPNVSPLVSQACSPSQSRSSSPLRTQPRAPHPTIPIMASPHGQPTVVIPHPPGGTMPMGGSQTVGGLQGAPSIGAQPPMMPMEQMSVPSQQSSQSQSSAGFGLPARVPPDLDGRGAIEFEELSPIRKDDQSKHSLAWPELKPINGMRLHFPPPASNIRPSASIQDQMQNLTLTEENVHYHSNSSSNSSPHNTPPSTPMNTASTTTTPHGPGRGGILDRGVIDRVNMDRGAMDNKSRPNGLPGFPPFCDTTSPPPPAGFNPFQTYATMPPNRFSYTTAYRPAVTFAQYPYPPGTTAAETPHFPTYTAIPYVTMMYSSYPPPPQQQPPPPQHAQQPPPPSLVRNPPGCYNCGSQGHLGSDCPQQSLEDITDKKPYRVRYSPVLSESGDK